MERISINEAISSGEWLQYDNDKDNLNGDFTMKLKLLSIREVQLEEIGDIDRVDKSIPLRNGRLLILSMELINFSKVQQYSYEPFFALIDQDNFEFNTLDDGYLVHYSELAKRYTLYLQLMPKLKYKVDFLFMVPVEDTQYFIGARFGTIKRI